MGVFAPDDRPDYLGSDRLLRWQQTAAGHHVELGISEMNLFLALHALRPRPRAPRRAPAADRHRVRPVRLSWPRCPDLRALQRGPLRRRRHARRCHARPGGRRPPVVDHAVDRSRTAGPHLRRAGVRRRRSTGCCATACSASPFPTENRCICACRRGRSIRAPFLAAKERLGAERIRGDVLAGAYRLVEPSATRRPGDRRIRPGRDRGDRRCGRAARRRASPRS